MSTTVFGSALAALYERVTGRPYLTGRTASSDFGATPGQIIAQVFGNIPDDVALAHGEQLYAEARRILAEQAARRALSGGAR